MMRYTSALIVVVICALFAFGLDRTENEVSGPAASTVSIDLPGPEGGEGFSNSTTPFNFRLTRAGDLTSPCSVGYETREGTAFAPEDFTHLSGIATFVPGQASVQVSVMVNGDIYRENEETFSLALVSTTGDCTISGSPVSATLLDVSGAFSNEGCVLGMEGDVASSNAALRVDDLVQLRRIILGLTDFGPAGTIPGCLFQIADINGNCGDGRVDSADVTVLRSWILQSPVQQRACGPIGPV